ncbi:MULTISPECIES: hypothetical protein [unclassified Novosphingobium]|uniref:hypothetical protein n=1 Tax=unclassified Novosphingobium TaxID=2644732 RepID=UPI0013590E2F|nr:MULTISPECIES: hypothetical protein [unclassified Novosphingobium]
MSVTTKFPEGPWLFEPHGAFRTNVAGEEWPLGYISAGAGNPIFALHEVVGEFAARDLASAALKAAAAPELYEALAEAKGLADMAVMSDDSDGTPSDDQKALIALRAKIDAALTKATAA